MSKARSIFALQLVLGALGAGVTGVALLAGLSTITLQAPSTAALLRACRRFVLPQVTLGSALALALGSAAFAVLALAVRSAARQLRAQRGFLSRLRVAGSATSADVTVFADERPLAFCTGLLRPRIYVSDGAIRTLAHDELDAVLAHEGHHARYRDPLRIFFARTLSDSLFFLPVLRRLADRYAALAELAADGAAVRRHRGDTRPLAAALLTFDEGASSAVVGIAPERVDHLLGERPRWELPLALLAWAIVVVVALTVLALRIERLSVDGAVSLPLVAAQLCMLAMAVVPLLAGAAAVLTARQTVRTLRR